MQIDGLFSGVTKLHIVKNPSCKIVSQQEQFQNPHPITIVLMELTFWSKLHATSCRATSDSGGISCFLSLLGHRPSVKKKKKSAHVLILYGYMDMG